MKERNFFEIGIVNAIVDNLVKSGIKPKRIGVVTVTSDQQVLLQRLMNAYTVSVHSLYDLEGLCKDVLIISTVKHGRKCSYLKELRRLYTAFTKCRLKLILVGSVQQLMEVEPLDQFVAYIK